MKTSVCQYFNSICSSSAWASDQPLQRRFVLPFSTLLGFVHHSPKGFCMDRDIRCCLLVFSSSGVSLLPYDLAKYLLNCKTGTMQQGFSSCIVRFRQCMYRWGRSGLICLATLFIPTSSGYHDVPYWRPFADEINLTRCNSILRWIRLVWVFDLGSDIVSSIEGASGMGVGFNTWDWSL